MEQFSKYCKKKNVSVPLSIPILNISGEWKHALNFVNLLLVRTVSLKCTSSTWGMFFEKMRLFLLKRNSAEKKFSSKSSLMLHFWCGFWVGQRLQFKWCWTGLATLTCSIVPKHNIGHLSCQCTLFRFNKKSLIFFKKHSSGAWCAF